MIARIPASRAAIEDMIERLIDRLDAMDGDADLEPDQDGEAEPQEARRQPLFLTNDIAPAKRLGPSRRAA
jgi:hypothetical protein